MPVRSVTPLHHFLTFGALVVLATASLVVGVFVHLPFVAPSISLFIAAVKAVLVLWFFMHLAEQPFRARLAVAVALVLVLILVALTATDVATRKLVARNPRPTPDEAFYLR
jgi:cytochrome c oxidase subunit 4